MFNSSFPWRGTVMAGGTAVLVLSGIASSSAQSILVDNFDDGNLLASSWSAEWYGTTNTTPLTNRGLALRGANNGGGLSAPQFPSDKATSLTAHNGGLAFRYGNAGINAASNSIVAQRNHQTGLSITRSGSTYDLTQTPYLRVTAWRDDTVAAPGAGSKFVVIGTSADPTTPPPFTGANPYGWNSFGPSNGNLSTPAAVGFAITTSPQVFTIKLDDPLQFNRDSVYSSNVFLTAQTQQAAMTTAVQRLAFNYYRTGADSSTAMDPVAFFIDDIILSKDPAGYVTTASASTIDIGVPATIDVALRAMPSHDVTLNVASSNTGILTVSPGSLTFTQANWNVPQTITVTRVANGGADVQFSKGATLDLLYGGPSINVPNDISFTALPVSLSEMSVE